VGARIKFDTHFELEPILEITEITDESETENCPPHNLADGGHTHTLCEEFEAEATVDNCKLKLNKYPKVWLQTFTSRLGIFQANLGLIYCRLINCRSACPIRKLQSSED